MNEKKMKKIFTKLLYCELNYTQLHENNKKKKYLKKKK